MHPQPTNNNNNDKFSILLPLFHPSPCRRPMLFPLKEQICPRTSQIYNLRTPIPILFKPCTLEAVERVADALTAAHDALVLVVAERTLIADAYKGGWTHVGVAHRTFTVAFVAQTSDGNAGLFAAHDKVGVVTGHCIGLEGVWTSFPSLF